MNKLNELAYETLFWGDNCANNSFKTLTYFIWWEYTDEYL